MKYAHCTFKNGFSVLTDKNSCVNMMKKCFYRSPSVDNSLGPET